ncbi:Protein CBG17179 [Caenorhabditis briggsae]|uniref:Protein CBG17179 n=1 Tax=Caenorhabditis briggsae TaxID=6238 RepID=A8XQM0_CAEBR|nr:Protein CBG17179 [Caenorhabditis briggsae]CAP34945.2 Protein CBG17179 [Caenorhabditis briggsae]
MARSMFPFDDTYRVTFNGSLLPSQSVSGEIMPVHFSDTEAPESTTSTVSTDLAMSSPSTGITDIDTTSPESVDAKTDQIKVSSILEITNNNNNKEVDKVVPEIEMKHDIVVILPLRPHSA